MGWLVAVSLFFILFFMFRDQYIQISIYQNMREYFKHFFKQLSQQSNKAVALSVQSVGSDQQVRIQALSRPVACLGVCVCVFDCFLSIIALQSCLFEGTPHSLPQYVIDASSRRDIRREQTTIAVCSIQEFKTFFV